MLTTGAMEAKTLFSPPSSTSGAALAGRIICETQSVKEEMQMTCAALVCGFNILDDLKQSILHKFVHGGVCADGGTAETQSLLSF